MMANLKLPAAMKAKQVVVDAKEKFHQDQKVAPDPDLDRNLAADLVRDQGLKADPDREAVHDHVLDPKAGPGPGPDPKAVLVQDREAAQDRKVDPDRDLEVDQNLNQEVAREVAPGRKVDLDLKADRGPSHDRGLNHDRGLSHDRDPNLAPDLGREVGQNLDRDQGRLRDLNLDPAVDLEVVHPGRVLRLGRVLPEVGAVPHLQISREVKEGPGRLRQRKAEVNRLRLVRFLIRIIV